MRYIKNFEITIFCGNLIFLMEREKLNEYAFYCSKINIEKNFLNWKFTNSEISIVLIYLQSLTFRYFQNLCKMRKKRIEMQASLISNVIYNL